MKFICLQLFLFLSICISPQQAEKIETSPAGIKIKIRFKPEVYRYVEYNGKQVVEFPGFSDEGKPGVPALPSKVIYVAVPPSGNARVSLVNKNTFSMKNVKVSFNKKVSTSDSVLIYKDSEPLAEAFSSDNYPGQEIEVLGYTWIRDYYCAVIRINTYSFNWKKNEITGMANAEINIEYDPGRFYRINNEPLNEYDKVLHKVIINYEQASSFRSYRSFEADTSGNWIDYSAEYIKLAVPRDGIYRITYDDLSSYGVNPSSVNPALLKIILKGNEIPLFAQGEDDLSFDQGDYIEFYAEKNYSPAGYRIVPGIGEDYINFMDRYTDTTFLWLSWTGSPGLRAGTIDTQVSGVTDTVRSHPVKLHFEKDERLWYYDAVVPRVQLPFWQENKVWTWWAGGSGSVFEIFFDSPDFLPASQVKTYTRLISNAADISSGAHSFGAGLNSPQPQDTLAFDFRETVNLVSEFSSDVLTGADNVYRVSGLPTQASFHQALIDWTDIDFFRLNAAINDSLLIRIPDTAASSLKAVKITNVTGASGIILYKIKPVLKKIISYSLSSGVLTFTDDAAGGDAYLLITENNLESPLFVKKKTFVNLRDPGRGADYIIISNKELEQSVNSYRDFIVSAYSIRTELVFTDDIYDEFSFGFDKAEAIRDFLRAANSGWQKPEPAFLNIIGDGNYDYRKIVNPPGALNRKNLVPSYGNPVSDTWYVMWDSSSLDLPQMFVGRIPASTNEQVIYYLQKHQSYISRRFDDWNKNYLFFSGGNLTDTTQLSQIKTANNILLNNIVRPAPVGGDGTHFYKTTDPVTNLGPYTPAEIEAAVGRGGLFISYIGHSGTQTWDNGITSTSDIQNNYSDRHPLITDFGCSTGKFAEPDVDAFSELFILEGQAINYCGNSSFGYLSTSLRFPHLFYSELLLDSVLTVGEAHNLAKITQFQESGYSTVNRVFNYCNLLFGDPVISFKTPMLPNFTLSGGSVQLLGANPSDQTDSASFKILLYNFGRVINDSLNILITDRWQNSIDFSVRKKIKIPLFTDSITVSVPVKGKVGEHTLTVELDEANLINEIYETDNIAEYTYTLFSTSVRPVESEKYFTTPPGKIRFLNPVLFLPGSPDEIMLALSPSPDFSNPELFYKKFDTVFTDIVIDTLLTSERYWWKARLNNPSLEWSDVYSFRNTGENFDWFADYSFNQSMEALNVVFDPGEKSWKLASGNNTLEIHSAGSDDGEYGSMLYNGQEMLPNTFYWGIATAEIDTVTLKPGNFREFLYWDSDSDDQLTAYLDSLPAGTTVAMTICADGAQAVLGFAGGTPVRRAIENYGSLYADSVLYRDSWCIIGKKGAPQGSVPESFSRRYSGEAETGISKQVNYAEGMIFFPEISYSSNWHNITIKDSLPAGSRIEYFPIGIRDEGTDTLSTLSFSADTASLSFIDNSVYTRIKIGARLFANEILETPSVSFVGVNYDAFPELGTNYQAVSVSGDSLLAGENVNLSFYIYNAGESRADSFKVEVQVLHPDNTSETIFSSVVDTLNPSGRRLFSTAYSTSGGTGGRSFYINIDTENKIPELYEDNNFFTAPFYIKPDTSVPVLNITFDGMQILDNDYVSDRPEIRIEMSDQALLPVTDPSSVSVFLNDLEINPDSSIITYEFSTANPKVVATLRPELQSGEYNLRVSGRNTFEAASAEVNFLVSQEARILEVYNYPNPFSSETWFTFKLTQIPDEIRIKIFTVAGRLVREIKAGSSELRYDFNRIYWDGRDDDGDLLANGVYLYKVIMNRGNKKEDVTQKLSIVR